MYIVGTILRRDELSLIDRQVYVRCAMKDYLQNVVRYKIQLKILIN